MKKTAIIFDHDGTLVDSIEAIALMTNKALEQNGFKPCSLEDIKFGMGYQTDKRMAFHSGAEDPEMVIKLTKNFYEHMHSGGIEYLRVYDGIKDSLDKLAAAGYSMGMVSNNQGLFIRKAAAHLHYAYDLEIMLGEDNVRAKKPSGEGILQACAGLSAAPENCWYIGDAEFDLLAARAAGVKSGLVTWGAHPEEELVTYGADAIFRTPEEMTAFFLN